MNEVPIVGTLERAREAAKEVDMDAGPTSLARLVAEGRVRPAKRPKGSAPHPVPVDGLVSDLVAEQRR